MKNLTKFQKVLLVALVVCLVIGVIGIFATMTTSREPTEAELALYAPYDVLWDAMPGGETTVQERILSQCTAQGKETVGDNEYDLYGSDTLGQYLYNCGGVDKILVSAEGAVYIYYTDTDGRSVFLSCGADGLSEKSVYEPKTDILFYQSGETSLVWENFSNFGSM